MHDVHVVGAHVFVCMQYALHTLCNFIHFIWSAFEERHSRTTLSDLLSIFLPPPVNWVGRVTRTHGHWNLTRCSRNARRLRVADWLIRDKIQFYRNAFNQLNSSFQSASVTSCTRACSILAAYETFSIDRKPNIWKYIQSGTIIFWHFSFFWIYLIFNPQSIFLWNLESEPWTVLCVDRSILKECFNYML